MFKTTITKHRFVVLAALTAAVLLAGCKRQAASSEREGASTIHLAQLPITYSSVTHLAESRGYTDEENLDCVIVSVPAGPDVMTALRARASSAPGAGTIAVTPVISMIAAGDEPVVLATTLFSNRAVRLVTFEETGVTEDATTLKGKSVGIVRNTVGDIYLSRLLAKAGLTQKDVRLVHGRPNELKALLVRGDLDAATLWDPFIKQTIREYGREVSAGNVGDRGEAKVHVDPELYTLSFNIVTTRQKLDANRAALRRLLQANIRAAEYITGNRAAAQRELEQWLGLREGDLDVFMRTTEFRVSLDVPVMKRWMSEEMAWLKAIRPDSKIPENFDAYVDSSLLRGIDPSRVTE